MFYKLRRRMILRILFLKYTLRNFVLIYTCIWNWRSIHKFVFIPIYHGSKDQEYKMLYIIAISSEFRFNCLHMFATSSSRDSALSFLYCRCDQSSVFFYRGASCQCTVVSNHEPLQRRRRDTGSNVRQQSESGKFKNHSYY